MNPDPSTLRLDLSAGAHRSDEVMSVKLCKFLPGMREDFI